MISKGDLLEVNGKRVTAASDVYTKVIFDSYDLSIGRGGGEGGSAVSCINVVGSDGKMWTARFDTSQIRKITD
jgi:hypothetical protein